MLGLHPWKDMLCSLLAPILRTEFTLTKLAYILLSAWVGKRGPGFFGWGGTFLSSWRRKVVFMFLRKELPKKITHCYMLWCLGEKVNNLSDPF